MYLLKLITIIICTELCQLIQCAVAEGRQAAQITYIEWAFGNAMQACSGTQAIVFV